MTINATFVKERLLPHVHEEQKEPLDETFQILDKHPCNVGVEGVFESDALGGRGRPLR